LGLPYLIAGVRKAKEMKTNEEIKSMHDNQRDTGKSNEKTKP